MNFIEWWFVKHNFWSTFLTPEATLVWCVFTDSWWRFAVAFGLAFLKAVGKKHV
jgi:hypothetical protein